MKKNAELGIPLNNIQYSSPTHRNILELIEICLRWQIFGVKFSLAPFSPGEHKEFLQKKVLFLRMKRFCDKKIVIIFFPI